MTRTRFPLDATPRRIEFTSEERTFLHGLLRDRLRDRPNDPAAGRLAAALGKLEADVDSFTAREAQRLRTAVGERAADQSVTLFELALSMAVIERITDSFDLPDDDDGGARDRVDDRGYLVAR